MLELLWSSRALKDLRKLEKEPQARIVGAMGRFVRTGVGDIKRLSGIHPPEWRLRIGDWRLRFSKASDGKRLIVLRVLPRDKAY